MYNIYIYIKKKKLTPQGYPFELCLYGQIQRDMREPHKVMGFVEDGTHWPVALKS